MIKNILKKSIAYGMMLTTVVCTIPSQPMKVMAAETSQETQWNFEYTGDVQIFTAPRDGVYKLTAVGASGGGANSGSRIGLGGTTTGEIKLLAGDQLFVYVGQHGEIGAKDNPKTYNGGGAGYWGDYSNTNGNGSGNCKMCNTSVYTSWLCGSGGGATDFRLVKATDGYWYNTNHSNWNTDKSLNSRVLVAGGGGGSTTASESEVEERISYGNREYGSNYPNNGLGQDSTNNTGTCGHFLRMHNGGGGGGYFGGYSSNLAPGYGHGGTGYTDGDRILEGKLTPATNLGNGHAKVEYLREITSTLTLKLGNNAYYDGTAKEIKITGVYNSTIELKTPTREKYKFTHWTDLGQTGDVIIQDPTKFTFGVEDSMYKAHWMYDGEVKIEVSGDNLIHVEAIDDEIPKYYTFWSSTDGGKTFQKVNVNGCAFDETKTNRNFNYNGGYQSYEVLATGKYLLTAVGGSGGNGYTRGGTNCTYCGAWISNYSGNGGPSGKMQVEMELRCGDQINVHVGGCGGRGYGGYNGGGNGYVPDYYFVAHSGGFGDNDAWRCSGYNGWDPHDTSWPAGSGGGGGATDFRLNGNSSGHRIMAAGGGGGGCAVSADYYLHYIVEWRGDSGFDNSLGYRPNGNGLPTGSGGYTQNGSKRRMYGAGGGGWYGGTPLNNGLNGYSRRTRLKPVVKYDGSSGRWGQHGYAEIKFLDTDVKITNLDADFKVNPNDVWAPNAPEKRTLRSNGPTQLKCGWNECTDNGGIAVYKLEVKKDKTNELLYKSNTLEMNANSGVKGYYYYYDNSPTSCNIENEVNNFDVAPGGTTSAYKDKIKFTTDNYFIVERPNDVMYYHVATVDNAGNFSKSVTFEVPLSAFIEYDKNDEKINKYKDEVSTLGKGDVIAQEVLVGQSVIVKDNVKTTEDTPYTKDGYIFTGWNTKSDGTGEEFKAGREISYKELMEKYDQVTTLYAQWEPITFKLQYNGNTHWNTSQKPYLQDMRFDKPVTLLDNKFTRETGKGKVGNILLDKYEFIGWSLDKTNWMFENNWETQFKDKQGPQQFNLTIKDKDIVNLYATWQKPLSLTFNMNGGKMNGSAEDIVLNTDIFNSQAYYNFNLHEKKTPEKLEYYREQLGTIDAYGELGDNGVNAIYEKIGTDGTEYRFLGWSTDVNAKKPDSGLDVYNGKVEEYTIYNSETLYAVWEPVLKVQFIISRTLGDKNEGLPNSISASALNTNNDVALVIKPGEQGKYVVNKSGNITAIKVGFDPLITDIYDYKGSWTDKLNPNPTIHDNSRVDGIPESAKHGLNKIISGTSLDNKSISRKFYIPQYLGTNELAELQSLTGKTHVDVIMYNTVFTIENTDSYYWTEVMGKDAERIIINAHIGLLGEDTDGDGIPDKHPSILEDLRSKLKIRLK